MWKCVLVLLLVFLFVVSQSSLKTVINIVSFFSVREQISPSRLFKMSHFTAELREKEFFILSWTDNGLNVFLDFYFFFFHPFCKGCENRGQDRKKKKCTTRRKTHSFQNKSLANCTVCNDCDILFGRNKI